jgi:hypothetical protein
MNPYRDSKRYAKSMQRFSVIVEQTAPAQTAHQFFPFLSQAHLPTSPQLSFPMGTFESVEHASGGIPVGF